MKPSIQDIIDEINSEAQENKLFWVCETARTFGKILEDHLNELHPTARMAVEHYLKEEKI